MTRKDLVSGWLLLTLSAPVLAAEGNWPQWRGPNRDDISTETGLLRAWPDGGPKLAWKATGLGGGFAGVSLVGDRIFIMGENSESSFVFALNRADGKQIWSAKVGKPVGGGGHPGPRCTPTVDGDLVFVLGQFGDLVCVETATGKERWRKTMNEFGGKMMSDWGYSESPLVDGDKIVFTPGGPQGAIVALNKKTGALVWQSKELTDKASYSSLIVVEIGGRRQYIQLTGASVAGVAADDGKLLWRAPWPGRVAVIPTPIFHENQVYVSCGYGVGCGLFKISAAEGGFKAEQVYANKNMINHHGGVVLVGDHLYGFSDGKGWVCQNFKTGEVVWSNKGVGKGSLTYADGHLYLRGEDRVGAIALIEASPTAYKETGRFNQPDRSSLESWPHPVIAGGKLYIRDQDILFCYDVSSAK